METKKESSPRKIHFPVPTVIAILTGITSLLVFLTGKTNLPDILKGEERAETPTASPTTTFTPTTATTPTAKVSPTPTVAIIPTSAKLTAAPPTNADLESVPSIWILTDFQELAEPGSNAYTIEIPHDSTWLWDCYFCATDAAFQDFLATLSVEFWIDKVRLGEEYIRVYDQAGTKGWICRNWSTLLTGWPPDRSVFLEIRYTHNRATTDGQNEFAAGEYSQTIVVVVKG